VEYIRQLCQLKRLVKLHPLAKFDAKHRKFRVATDTSNEDAIVDIKQKGRSIMHKQVFKHVELVIRFDKERLKRQKLGFNARKFKTHCS